MPMGLRLPVQAGTRIWNCIQCNCPGQCTLAARFQPSKFVAILAPEPGRRLSAEPPESPASRGRATLALARRGRLGASPHVMWSKRQTMAMCQGLALPPAGPTVRAELFGGEMLDGRVGMGGSSALLHSQPPVHSQPPRHRLSTRSSEAAAAARIRRAT